MGGSGVDDKRSQKFPWQEVDQAGKQRVFGPYKGNQLRNLVALYIVYDLSWLIDFSIHCEHLRLVGKERMMRRSSWKEMVFWRQGEQRCCRDGEDVAA